MPPITDNELRRIAYDLLHSATVSILTIERDNAELLKRLADLKQSVEVAAEIIKQLNAAQLEGGEGE